MRSLKYMEMFRKIRLLKINDLAGKFPEQVVKHGLKKKADAAKKGAFHIKKLASNDKECAIDFLRRLFFHDEPMAKAVQLVDGPNDRCPELEAYIGSAIDDGISLVAVDANEHLVGVVINGLLHRNDSLEKKVVDKCKNPKFLRIIRFMAYLETESKLWDKVPSNCNILVDLKFASTDPEWRGRRIMQKLVEETECAAKISGACGVHLVASSLYSKRVVERLGYEMVYCVKYCEKPDAPQPEPPHDCAYVFLKLL